LHFFFAFSYQHKINISKLHKRINHHLIQTSLTTVRNTIHHTSTSNQIKQAAATMKRSYQETNTSDGTTSSVGIGEIMKTPRPILIEVEEHDTASRNNSSSSSSSSSKRQRKIAGASLNLLIRVMEEASALKDEVSSTSVSKSQGEGTKKIMVDRVPSDDYNRSFYSSSCSSSSSNSSVSASVSVSSAAACGECEDVVIAVSTINASVTTVTPNSNSSSSLPCGRPLMAPPRFPTQFFPVQQTTTTQSKTAPLTTTTGVYIINNNSYTLKPLSVKLLPKQQVK
jgi:hypothetical protein